jgi:hypothetical protein
MPNAKLAAIGGFANVVAQSICAISNWLILPQMLLELVQQRAKPPLVGQHAMGNSLGKGIEIHAHRVNCSVVEGEKEGSDDSGASGALSPALAGEG